MQPELSEIIHWATHAGNLLAEAFEHPHQVKLKSVANLVTEMDRLSEQYLLEHIRSKYPAHAIVTEESGFLSGEMEHCWYIDPLDGTTNYAHGIPFFAVSIAYAENGVVRLGVVYDPMQRECFAAERGRGATLNYRPIHVSDVESLENSLLATSFPNHLLSTEKNNLDHFFAFMYCTHGVRRIGSAALDLCYTAAGRLDGYWDQSLAAWDVAAAALILEEAGGVVTDFDGGPDYMKPPYALVASTPALHPLMLEKLHPRR